MIHAYINNGYRIVLDVNSGAVHLPDALTFELIPEIEKLLVKRFGTAAQTDRADDVPKELTASLTQDILLHPEEKIAAALAVAIAGAGNAEIDELLSEPIREILTLREQGQLYTEDPYEKAASAFKNRQTVVKALCLNVAHACNLACRYCFAGQGEYQGERALMTTEVGRAALDFLVKNSGSRKNLEVDFFGGEPLLNWEMVKETVRYGRSLEEANNKHFRFTLTTNGTLLNDEILAFANQEMDNIVLSIDGRREVNDRMRPWRGADGTDPSDSKDRDHGEQPESVYDRIVPKYLKVAESRGGERYFVRGTFTRDNLDFSEDVKHLADLGFTQISVEPVVADPKEAYALREEDIPTLLEEYDRLARFYLERRREGRSFSFFHFNIDLEGGPCVYKRLSGCGAGCEYLGVTPQGDLYPCHQFVGNEAFVMGNVFDGITRPDIRDRFLASNVYTREECRGCFARYYCSGGCAANAYHYGGDIDKNYPVGCALQKKRIECAIMIKAALADEESE